MPEITQPRILLIGTGDTKADELQFMSDCIARAGGTTIMMDISVLGDPPYQPAHDKHAVAAAAQTTIADIASSGDENTAMSLMAVGAANLARDLAVRDAIDAVIAIGGTMGTDLALDVAQALPLGLPKLIVSTVAFSHLIPPERVAADLMMILWAGGLYGLNGTCTAVLSQACGAIVGAAKSAIRPQKARPVVAITSLGKSCLRYMVELKPQLEKRGYEVVIFHTTGMGGRAMESIAAQGGFAAVLDLSLQEVANQFTGSMVNSGADRLENAGRACIPQIVAPGAVDMVDFPAWLPIPKDLADRPFHAHNRLLASATSRAVDRRRIAHAIAEKLSHAKAPVAFVLPTGGIQQWDRAGEPLHDPEALSAFVDAMRSAIAAPVELHEVEDHINSAAFNETVLGIFDRWVEAGIVPAGHTTVAA
ncbi:Tm-1-like ATP-binding domain-containing protein [Bradyrhizobium sp. ISRA443]|uniref:Tm-1-like ATP-binding domain-containing protein n=1 Tax=unclassified Bradyrhizobium TaxID=2631580 RepID=UPI00247879A4|nr:MULTISPECIES: Tm-1-like ATP-binding domain-containing protein [unclassified Bradyrhizobium]WGR92710.1 Tm-1-like ATP-binding domain-containing protein [Bradyrhizobium sp. ISRA435]WGR97160.1 Tm-1-like ATP-binding domain-containing protein [Bradyrhizobium sp. ISRA436]WGS04048.1 Tm-1-like ATP-binding domain-containing protein [Bradyrhizobium sp. ISRA437]WGS10931.1 Tm-1-like ATP-binding domain-containing protein [Bradyrhizobium sp. ISRA443]